MPLHTKDLLWNFHIQFGVCVICNVWLVLDQVPRTAQI